MYTTCIYHATALLNLRMRKILHDLDVLIDVYMYIYISRATLIPTMPSILSDGLKYVSCPSRRKIKIKIGTYTPEHFSKCKHNPHATTYLHNIIILNYIIKHAYYVN